MAHLRSLVSKFLGFAEIRTFIPRWHGREQIRAIYIPIPDPWIRGKQFFWPCSLNPTVNKYSNSYLKSLADFLDLKTLRSYLLYDKFTVQTVYAAVSSFLTRDGPSDRLTQWAFRLAEYNFKFSYKKGVWNQQGDSLSRLATVAETVHEEWDAILCFLTMEYELVQSDSRRFE